ncbi:DUF3995 domain-containing protein [Natronococcus pandeyae]|uniref:DUF3995 domain-containing protein n=1 Tax=Natronococcus pandeyae TaxID=2055836 RepID=A0A8J8PZS6_9EURY|nr:DUF3995 domain-containing protein [Natronococcus pandeyae]TYL37841.1 DUF3995 domain-containing protein [Natronococcus pandeyae]
MAATWWTIFAAFSFYWAAGGTFALGTLGEGIESHAVAREGWFVTLVAVTGVVKLLPALLVLSLIQTWGDRLPWRIRLLAVGGLGVLSALYGAVSILQKTLVLIGVFSPEDVDPAGFWGHFLIWDPVWVIGGLLLCVTAWSYRE